jgi:hypothetical protein
MLSDVSSFPDQCTSQAEANVPETLDNQGQRNLRNSESKKHVEVIQEASFRMRVQIPKYYIG